MPDDASFCPACGLDHRISPDQQPPSDVRNDQPAFVPTPYTASGYPQQTPPQMPVQRRKNTRLIIILAAAIVLVAAAIVILAILIFGKSPDIEGTWKGRITLEMSEDDSNLEDDFADLLDRSSDAVLIFDMDDEKTGTAEIFFEDYPTEEIELSVKLKGKKISLSGDMLGYNTELSGKIDQNDDEMTLTGSGAADGRKGSMSIDLDFDKESDKKIRPTTEETTYDSTGSDDPSSTTNEGVVDTTPPVTDTAPPTETTTAETTQEVTVTLPTESLVDDPDAVLTDYLPGDWVSSPYPDGTASILVFYDYENVTWFISYPGESTDNPMDGYKNGSWDIEYISDGTYYIENNQLYMSWLDMDGLGDIYDVAIIDENTLDLTLYFDDESFTDRYQRVIWE